MSFNVFAPAPFDEGAIVRCSYPTTGLKIGQDYLIRDKRRDEFCFQKYDVVNVEPVGGGMVISDVFAARFELVRSHRATESHPRPFAGKDE